MIVNVIVDLPNAQVNQPFDYQVPEELEGFIELGIRIEVPFGSRKLMGFVVGIAEESSFEGELRDISRVIDYQSYLNKELIELSFYLTDYLQAFHINVLQAMLPNMLKVKYHTTIEVLDEVGFKAYVQEKEIQLADFLNSYERDDFEASFKPSAIRHLIQEKIVQLKHTVIDQTNERIENFLICERSPAELEEILAGLRPNSHRQIHLIQYLLKHPLKTEMLQRDFTQMARTNQSTVKAAIDKGWLTQSQRKVYRNPFDQTEVKATQARTLLEEQAKVFQAVLASMQKNQSDVFLLEGVTGSGKTEVYLQLMQQVIEAGQTALLLVPEISLTPQMVSQVRGRFQTGIAVLHSALSVAERYDEWRRIINGEVSLVVGARSSIFAPIQNLGLIIIDEEHESTYKQDTIPRYHARDVAIWRGQYNKCPILLGSATPSLESRARAATGNYQFLTMFERVNKKDLPEVDIIDMTAIAYQDQLFEFSPQLRTAIEERLERKEQIVLLLNRRGYSSYILCRTCGHVFGCPNCDVSLTYHKTTHRLQCHYCNFKRSFPTACENCTAKHLLTQGLGIQKVAENIEQLFPQARLIRMDNDTTRRKGEHERLLKVFENHEADILLGTQMIAKGLDFENVTLVGVINADTSLYFPDFRAAEKTFQLLTQVSGRAGRGDKPGQAIIQTYNPQHYVMNYVKRHDYESFFTYEMNQRRLTQNPPYYFTTLITVSSKKQAQAQESIYALSQSLRMEDLIRRKQLILVGPSATSIERVNGFYYYQLLLKYKNKSFLQERLNKILEQSQELEKKKIYIAIDHEPLFFM